MRKVSLLPLIFLFVCVSIPEQNSTGDFEISRGFIWCHCVWLETTPSLISRAGGEPNFCGQVRQAQALQPQVSTQEGLLEVTSQEPPSGNLPNECFLCSPLLHAHQLLLPCLCSRSCLIGLCHASSPDLPLIHVWAGASSSRFPRTLSNLATK